MHSILIGIQSSCTGSLFSFAKKDSLETLIGVRQGKLDVLRYVLLNFCNHSICSCCCSSSLLLYTHSISKDNLIFCTCNFSLRSETSCYHHFSVTELKIRPSFFAATQFLDVNDGCLISFVHLVSEKSTFPKISKGN